MNNGRFVLGVLMQVIYKKDQGQKVPVKIWGDLGQIDAKAIGQAINIASLPAGAIFSHVAIMPDAHFCNGGCPVGTVVASKEYLYPTIVGADIGCGVLSWNSGKKLEEIDVDLVMKDIVSRVPIFRNQNNIKQFMGQNRADICSLGNGNHQCELDVDKDNNVWVLIHTGSRDFGGQIAKKHFKIAKQFHAKYFCNTTPELPFFLFDSKEGQEYWKEMNSAVEFARMNRFYILREVQAALGVDRVDHKDQYTDMPHNFARFENHFGQNLIVHRKGAAPAQEGKTGIIPGSMTTKSYIVKGKGNPDSFSSSSHGAGRVCSRKESKQKLEMGLVESEESQLAGRTVYGTRDYQDELGHSYKDIDQVMNQQADLVEKVVELKPVATYKG